MRHLSRDVVCQLAVGVEQRPAVGAMIVLRPATGQLAEVTCNLQGAQYRLDKGLGCMGLPLYGAFAAVGAR